MNKKKHLIVLAGATATGKTGIGIQMAKRFQTEILSCDSRQFYQEMNIGTAKPDLEELNQVKHHFINSISIKQNYTVGNFEGEANQLLKNLFQKKDLILMVGGAGLFIKAVCDGLDQFPEVQDGIRQEVEALFQKHGIDLLQKELKNVDPDYYKEVDLQNPHRLIRAISVIRSGGKPFSTFRSQSNTNRSFQPVYLCLYRERALLYDRINARVDEMIKKGLFDEAKKLYPEKGLTALQTVGYQEIFTYLDGDCTLEEAIGQIKQNSRRYAKRQGTWFRKDPHWFYFRPDELDLAYQYIDLFVKEKIQIKRASEEDSSALDRFYKKIEKTNESNKNCIFIMILKDQLIIGIAKIGLNKKQRILQAIDIDPDFEYLPVAELLKAQSNYYEKA